MSYHSSSPVQSPVAPVQSPVFHVQSPIVAAASPKSQSRPSSPKAKTPQFRYGLDKMTKKDLQTGIYQAFYKQVLKIGKGINDIKAEIQGLLDQQHYAAQFHQVQQLTPQYGTTGYQYASAVAATAGYKVSSGHHELNVFQSVSVRFPVKEKRTVSESSLPLFRLDADQLNRLSHIVDDFFDLAKSRCRPNQQCIIDSNVKDYVANFILSILTKVVGNTLATPKKNGVEKLGLKYAKKSWIEISGDWESLNQSMDYAERSVDAMKTKDDLNRGVQLHARAGIAVKPKLISDIIKSQDCVKRSGFVFLKQYSQFVASVIDYVVRTIVEAVLVSAPVPDGKVRAVISLPHFQGWIARIASDQKHNGLIRLIYFSP